MVSLMLLVVCWVVVVVVLDVADRRGATDARSGCGARTTSARDGSGIIVAAMMAEAFNEAIRLTRRVSIISTVWSISSRRFRAGVEAGFFFAALALVGVLLAAFLAGVFLELLAAFDVDGFELLEDAFDVEAPPEDEEVLGLL